MSNDRLEAVNDRGSNPIPIDSQFSGPALDRRQHRIFSTAPDRHQLDTGP